MDILEIMDTMAEATVCARTRKFAQACKECPDWVYNRDEELLGLAQDTLGLCAWQPA